MKVGCSSNFVEAVLLCLILFPIGILADMPLRFRKDGTFKILQVADMHYATGKNTTCEDVFPSQEPYCSDLNTTAFLERTILAENPDLIVFTGDNIYGLDCPDPKKSLSDAFAPAIASNIPWAVIMGNHDDESTLSRKDVMKYTVTLKNTLSKFNPENAGYIEGFGNYNLEVGGAEGSKFENKSVLNLYFLDSGNFADCCTDRDFPLPGPPEIHRYVIGYDWVKNSQQFWLLQTSKRLQQEYMADAEALKLKVAAPALAFLHIPPPEFNSSMLSKKVGVQQESVSSPSVNSGLFTSLASAKDVKALIVGHDHLNDYCAELFGLQLCYGGGFGYHAYGLAGWARRARVVVVNLDKTENGWGPVQSIKTRKRLDDANFTAIDDELLWDLEYV
ncbi:hypothetical protein ACB098_01G141400 [Castanea mollissima]|uniref:putative inactive purple acid phosphatase 29 n=1 Tax=Castanea sativa TaxID=21020 RepID=UPI003F653E4F